MNPENAAHPSAAVHKRPVPRSPDQVAFGPSKGRLTGRYWDALWKLPRVHVCGSMSSGLVFSRSEVCPARGRRQP